MIAVEIEGKKVGGKVGGTVVYIAGCRKMGLS